MTPSFAAAFVLAIVATHVAHVAVSGSPSSLTYAGSTLLQENDGTTRAPASDGKYLYLPAYNFPSRLTKFDLATSTRVASLEFEMNENKAIGATVSDGFCYVALSGQPSKIVKVNTETMTRAAALTLGAGQDVATTIISDGVHLFFGTFTHPCLVGRILLSTFERADVISLGSGENNGYTSVIDNSNTTLYVCCHSTPATCVAIRIRPVFERVAGVKLESGETNPYGVVHDGAHLLVGLGTDPGAIVKVDTQTMTRVGALRLGENQVSVRGLVLAGDRHVLAFCHTVPMSVFRVRIADMALQGSEFAEMGDNYVAVDGAIARGTDVFVVTFATAPRVVRWTGLVPAATDSGVAPVVVVQQAAAVGDDDDDDF